MVLSAFLASHHFSFCNIFDKINATTFDINLIRKSYHRMVIYFIVSLASYLKSNHQSICLFTFDFIRFLQLIKEYETRNFQFDGIAKRKEWTLFTVRWSHKQPTVQPTINYLTIVNSQNGHRIVYSRCRPHQQSSITDHTFTPLYNNTIWMKFSSSPFDQVEKYDYLFTMHYYCYLTSNQCNIIYF